MKKIITLATLLTLSMAGSSFAAAYVEPDDNLKGITLCVDNDSFQAAIGNLSSTSGKLAQGTYDYFVAQAKAYDIPFTESGAKQCTDWAVELSFGATTGTPRAWYGTIWISDAGAYYAPNAKSVYPSPVTIWQSTTYGLLPSNEGLSAYLLDQGKSLVDILLDAYIKGN
jgi:hypothetical protein